MHDPLIYITGVCQACLADSYVFPIVDNPRNWLDAGSLPDIVCSLSTIVLSLHGTHPLTMILTEPNCRPGS